MTAVRRCGWVVNGPLTGAVLSLLILLFWKTRIVDLADDKMVRPLGSADLYNSHYIMMAHAFSSLRRGIIPLWNPYQLCGEPFLAVPYMGLFYPLNLVYLYPDTGIAIELSLILHMLLGALGMWFLARHLGMGNLSGACGGLAFVCSGFLVHRAAYQPQLHAAITWMPVITLLLDRVLAGRKRAWIWLVVGLTAQILIGAGEVFLHTLYVALVWGVLRLGRVLREGGWSVALRRGSSALGCVFAGLLLSAPQLAPTVELVAQSARAPGALSLREATWMGAIPPVRFLRQALESEMNLVTVGALAVFALALGLGSRKHRMVWIFAAIASLGAALLVFGGPAYGLYYRLPVVGSLFRRPNKFLDIYCFGQSLMVAVAVSRLSDWVGTGRRTLFHPAWLLALLVGAAGLAWQLRHDSLNLYVLGLMGLLLLFGCLPRPQVRKTLMVGICAIQVCSLFFTVGNRNVRPFQQPGVFKRQAKRLRVLPDQRGYARVYLSQLLSLGAILPSKRGLMNEVYVVTDNEPLANARYAAFFEYVSGRTSRMPFFGQYLLGPESRWRLMDLTGTRYFFMRRGERGDRLMKEDPSQFKLVHDGGLVRLYERRSVRPRAYFVPGARLVTDPADVLRLLNSKEFDPAKEVVLEDPEAPAARDALGRSKRSHVRIARYQPEHVLISTRVDTAGYLVLTDLFYPGWKAFAGGREIPIYRANYLFRAVPIGPRDREVRFEYRPASFRIGLLVGFGTAAAIVILGVFGALVQRP